MKKIYWVLIIVFIVIVLAALGLFIWSNHRKAQLSKQRQNLIELPAGTDPAQLTANQAESLYDQIAKKYPAQYLKGATGNLFSLIQEILLTQNNNLVPYGLNLPPVVNTNVTPITPENPPVDEDEEELKWPRFTFSGANSDPVEQQKAEAELVKVKALVSKYYPVIVDLYGLPCDVENRHIGFVYSNDPNLSGYLPQYDFIILHSSGVWEVVPGLVAAFSGKYYSKIPETWKYGMTYYVTELAIRQFPEDANPIADYFIGLIQSDYEKFNDNHEYPIWGANINFENDILGIDGITYRIFLASAAVAKPYAYDNQVFVNFNQKLYSLDMNSSLWTNDVNLFNHLVSGSNFSIEGISAPDWYKKQQVLHQTETDPILMFLMQVLGQTFTVKPAITNQIQIYQFSSLPSNNGMKFIPRQSNSIRIKIANHKNEAKYDQNKSSDSKGKISFYFSDVGISENGRYNIKTYGLPNTNIDFLNNSSPPSSTIYGVVTNFGSGKIAAVEEDNTIIETVDISNGVFSFTQILEGVIKLVVKDYNGVNVAERPLAKDIGPYFAILISPTSSYPAAPPTGTRGGTGCDNIDTSDWKTYDPKDYGWSIKYPSDWGYDEKIVNPSEIAPQWDVGFGFKEGNNVASVVWVGYGVTDAEPLEANLTGAIPGFDILSKETVTIDNTRSTRYLLQGRAASYQTYIYAIPFFNLGYLLQGPAIESSSQFEKCEPQIFKAMVSTFKKAPMTENEMPSM